jgi:predicted unusual protein kinase regulating ubiquinone biosynthesis (AarF/ABC1/UbiB family)
MSYFNDLGRRVPTDGLRVFAKDPQTYYQLALVPVDYSQILKNSIEFGGVSPQVSLEKFKSACDTLKQKIAGSTATEQDRARYRELGERLKFS